MGKPTGTMMRFIKGLGYGSDHFGKCEVCGKHASETFKGRYKKEWVRENGEIYYGGDTPSVYGHESCVREQFPEEVIISSNPG